MSLINRAQIYCPPSVTLELGQRNGFCVLWISGSSGTWFIRIKNEYYRAQLLAKSKLNIKTFYFYNIVKHYFASYYRPATPQVNASLSSICVLIKRMIIGASVGYKKYLRVRGVGYKFEVQNLSLTAKVGYTHLVRKELPHDFSIKFSRKAKVIRLRSKSLTKLTRFIGYLRALRRPDVYKGKGIRYKRDPIRRKPGKRKTRAASKKRRIFNKRTAVKPRRRRRRSRRKGRLLKKLKLMKFLRLRR